jgi:hypothetical protein
MEVMVPLALPDKMAAEAAAADIAIVIGIGIGIGLSLLLLHDVHIFKFNF